MALVGCFHHGNRLILFSAAVYADGAQVAQADIDTGGGQNFLILIFHLAFSMHS